LPNWLPAEAAVELLRAHYIRPLGQAGSEQRSNMLVITPTLQALIELDKEAIVDLAKRELVLPKYGKRLPITVSPEHNG
jgi:hypothetical protein